VIYINESGTATNQDPTSADQKAVWRHDQGRDLLDYEASDCPILVYHGAHTIWNM